jgi:hypothetical protein
VIVGYLGAGVGTTGSNVEERHVLSAKWAARTPKSPRAEIRCDLILI